MTKLPDVEFKAGDMVYSLIEARFFKLEYLNNKSFCLGSNIRSYTTKGLFDFSDQQRSLLTLSEAAKLGLTPPEPKKRFVKKTMWKTVKQEHDGQVPYEENILIGSKEIASMGQYVIGVIPVEVEMLEGAE